MRTPTGQLVSWRSHNRSVTASGEQKSVAPGNCRGTTAFTLDAKNKELGGGYSPRSACGTREKFSITVPADVSGGAAVVRIRLDDGAPSVPPKYLSCKGHGR
ncbi:hypothetical protein ACFU9B_33780 [Streptomyces sp. NPDC057592]|uniref:hypothetical protein n=1 Tax=unclassified Streptomyces TaxID=2593676 RepID=UPI0036BDEA95